MGTYVRTVPLTCEDVVQAAKVSKSELSTPLNSLYTGRLFHCYVLDEFICHFRSVGFIYRFYSIFLWKILLACNVGPDLTPHYVASDLGLHCLPMTLKVKCR